MRGQAFLAAAIAAASLMAIQPAAAQGYNSYHDEHVSRQQQCRSERQNRAVTGAIIGGIAGAVLGSQASGRGHRTDGSVLGGVVGAAAGAAIGNSSANRNCDQRVQGQYDPYYGQRQDGYQQYGQNDRGYEDGYARNGDYGDEDLYGGPNGDRRYSEARNSNCGWQDQITRDRRGRERRESVYMCQGRDGIWRAS